MFHITTKKIVPFLSKVNKEFVNDVSVIHVVNIST